MINAWPRASSWLVHMLTTSGAVFSMLAVLAVGRDSFVEAFLWLGAALFVDGIDGPLARIVRVEERVPWFDGAILDLVIDYSTYVFIPALILARSDILPPGLGVAGAVLVVAVGAIYFADTRMKTADYGFRGFPAVWNMVVFVLMAFDLNQVVAAAIIVLFAVLTFAPIEFVHPFRVKRLRAVTLTVTFAWAAFSILALADGMAPSLPVLVGLGTTTVYLTVIGAVLQATRPRAAH
ncbi:phosphatidylcholine/phosphatidylserine synthase [Kaistia geumhonensis]|uniref:Phosphatidylcholine synthase n=1 Tax=Kaistia geumhonensis TaxID=410839 RepID=A0ABU0M180_9HYPH|nr:phosphatidylcholine/phosphatidylserine synthase [Kaistia geumhonensis]MCX5480065.1 phosphatidylcholine/phosphatidylserine synthase [Kaistia geumhonensis]MDQ0514707.1 phosphatidylcholine synthase [Kaistia geumhonensis]